jgi:hypothetical protein
VDGAAANGDTPGHFETSRFTTRGIFRKHCGVGGGTRRAHWAFIDAQVEEMRPR